MTNQPQTPKYTREELIALCEAAAVPMREWRDRDSHAAQKQLGVAWSMLRADVPFRIDPDTDADTVWVEFYDIEDFDYVEIGEKATDTRYIPTRKRLTERAGKDWY